MTNKGYCIIEDYFISLLIKSIKYKGGKSEGNFKKV